MRLISRQKLGKFGSCLVNWTIGFDGGRLLAQRGVGAKPAIKPRDGLADHGVVQTANQISQLGQWQANRNRNRGEAVPESGPQKDE